ncbi:hypothetical protein D9V75_02835 [Buchnera aphidicola (Muscaphis stroyani)]|uniref:Uncharacterized protein n=1 Tax=Buchnera aphidicola (Muscaphis stroyani) TaxID=1241869 RepID=A0A4D6Y890_9GAMM|nr:hypothetical protein [Buchnera aphidicola]QCI24613.1 hypothetical protein D9V75_02835 [Buchnera aphidicola (Muscaphis stroyani)]
MSHNSINTKNVKFNSNVYEYKNSKKFFLKNTEKKIEDKKNLNLFSDSKSKVSISFNNKINFLNTDEIHKKSSFLNLEKTKKKKEIYKYINFNKLFLNSKNLKYIKNFFNQKNEIIQNLFEKKKLFLNQILI